MLQFVPGIIVPVCMPYITMVSNTSSNIYMQQKTMGSSSDGLLPISISLWYLHHLFEAVTTIFLWMDVHPTTL
jgi:hypothetical protein